MEVLSIFWKKFPIAVHKMEKYVSKYCIQTEENNKKSREKFPDMKLFVFKGFYRRTVYSIASFSESLSFPAVLRKYTLYNFHQYSHKCSLRRRAILFSAGY